MASQIEAVIKLRDEASAQLKKLSKEAKRAGGEFDDLEEHLEDAGDAAKKTGKAQTRLAKETKKAGDEAAKSGKKFKFGADALEGFSAHAGKFAAAGAAAVGVGMVALAKGAIDAVAELETFEVQLEVLLKDSDLAKQRLETLFKIGSTTPFELGSLVQADVIIQSFGADANVLRSGIMDLAGAMNKELPDAALAVAKSFAVGKAGSDGLKESFALLYTDVLRRAEEMGDPSDIKIWQQSMTDALNAVDGVVAGGTEKLAKTFRGKLSNMADNWFKLKVAIGKAGLFDFVSTGMKVMLEDMDNATGGVEALGKAISEDLVTAMEGIIRVVALVSQGFLLLGIGIEAIIGAVHGGVTIFYGLLLVLDKVLFAYHELQYTFALTDKAARDHADEMAKVARRAEETRQAGMAAGDALFSSIDRIDRMRSTLLNLGGVGDKLDEVRTKVEGIKNAAKNPVKITVETEYTTKGGEGGKGATTKAPPGYDPDVWAMMMELAQGADGGGGTPKKDPPKGKDPFTGGGGGSGSKVSPAIEAFQTIGKALESMAPKETLSRLDKLNALWFVLEDAQTKFGDSSKTDWDALWNQLLDIGEAEKIRVKEMAESGAAEEQIKLVRELEKTGEAARVSARELNGTWNESDKLGVTLAEARQQLVEYEQQMLLLGLTTEDSGDAIAGLEARIAGLAAAREKALRAEATAAIEALGAWDRFKHVWSDFWSSVSESISGGFASASGDLVSAGLKLGGSVLKGVTSVASQGLGSIVGAAGPGGAAMSAISGIGGMGYTKSEEYVDPKTGEKKTRDVEVSAAEAIGEQMEGFLDGFIIGIVEVLPELISEVIPKFIIEGVPALITGLLEAMPKIGMALFINLPIALVKGLGQWWHEAWTAIKVFFRDVGGLFGKDAGKEWGKVGAGAAAGAAAGMAWGAAGGPIGMGAGAAIGAIAGAVFHSGGYVDRTGPALLQQGERVVPATGADTGTARASGLAAFAGGGGANVTIHTSVVDPDSINRLGVLLDEQFGSYGRNSLPIMG